MKVVMDCRISEAPRKQIEELAGLLKTPSDCGVYPKALTGWLKLRAEEEHPDVETFIAYCQSHGIRFYCGRLRIYSKVERDTTALSLVRDEEAEISSSGTQYSSHDVCPRCGIGLRQSGPLVLGPGRLPKQGMFCVSIKHSEQWVIRTEFIDLFQGFTGFHFGMVSSASQPKSPLYDVQQIIVDNYLPRMATITNFTEYDPPMRDKCSCSRAGWNLCDELIYTCSAAAAAKDFNWTVERWYGGGWYGINGLIVSQRVRQAILKQKLLSPGCFEPVHIIDEDPGVPYKFNLPLDAPVARKTT